MYFVRVDVPQRESAPPSVGLSLRQRQCLDLAAQGLTSADIAVRLGLSPRTIDEHILNACRALGVRTRIQAVARLAFDGRPQSSRSAASTLAVRRTF